MNIRPLADRVVLKRLEAEEKTKSGIVLAGSAKEKPQEAEVIAVGPGGVTIDGKEIKMEVKVGDKVKILAGKDKGKEGTVTTTLRKKDKVVVSGINIVKKHMKPNAMNETGGIVSVEAPIHVSNVSVIESSKAKTTKKETKPKKEAGEK